MNNIKLIKKLEKSAYPSIYRYMQHIKTIDDVVEYCEAENREDIICVITKTFYFLAVKSTGEIVDLAGEMTLSDLIQVKNIILSNFKGKVITFDSRESTSYKLIRRLGGEIIQDEVYLWGDEKYHSMKILI